MSKENLEQFVNQVADSEELQATIGDEIDINSLIALGAEHGYEFTEEELLEPFEFSDEELDGIAGGSGDFQTKSSWRLTNLSLTGVSQRHIFKVRGQGSSGD